MVLNSLPGVIRMACERDQGKAREKRNEQRGQRRQRKERTRNRRQPVSSDVEVREEREVVSEEVGDGAELVVRQDQRDQRRQS